MPGKIDVDMERKLSTVFALDVVGFSRLMADDEGRTLTNLEIRREFIDSLIEEFGGRIFNTAGDSVLAEFPSPVKAVECSVQVQNRSQSLNNQADSQDQMNFRIGINVGDVMVSGDNLFGDAINIAARLEAEANMDGICISQSTFDMVNLKINVSFEDAGELDLKNIGRPIRAYHLTKSKGATRGLISSADAPNVQVDQRERGSIAVMLFKNLSNDEEQGYFCEGFAEDLISALSRYKKLVVISSNASFSYSEKNKSISEIGNELGVKYVLEGKVRKLGQRLRIATSLLSAENGNTLWSNNYDASLDEIFDLQDELVQSIVSTIVGNVERDEVKRLSNAKPERMDAYDLVLKGLEHHRKGSITGDHNKKALEFFDKAIELDPQYARAYAWRTCSLANNAEWFPDDMPSNWMEDAFASLNRSLELDPNDPEAHRIMGAVKLLIEGDMDTAIFHHQKAIEICPSDTYHIARYAILLCYLGKPDEGLEEITRAMRLNPFCSDILFEAQGLSLYWLDKPADALSSFKKMQIDSIAGLFYQALCYQALDEADNARSHLNMAISDSGMTVEKFVSTQLYDNEELKNNLSSSLTAIADAAA